MKEITLEGLLKDASFLANKEKGIPHFCIEPEKRGDFWKNLSKHAATKPITQSLNAIMSDRSFEEAMEQFLRNLSVKIPKEEEKDLEKFVLGVREIVKKYFNLRQKNISEFIKAKNSLISAIFIFTRYSNLSKEICDE